LLLDLHQKLRLPVVGFKKLAERTAHNLLLDEATQATLNHWREGEELRTTTVG
jgi:hypothetical protein